MLSLAGALLLSACSHRHGPPPFTASGYVGDRGVVRLWRKDDDDGAVHLLAVFSPWHQGNTSLSDYRWQGNQLTSLSLSTYSQPPEKIKVRFDQRGGLSFMQREYNGQKQQLSDEQIALYQYQASQLRETSDALRAGQVVLRQGRWQGDGVVTTCKGERVQPEFEPGALSHILRRQSRSSLAVSVAWLEAPEGTQLLLVANEDFCHWQPKPDSF